MDNKKFLNKKLCLLVVGIVFLVAVLVGIWAIASKRAAIVWKKPTEQALVVGQRVCDDAVVNTFNKVSKYTLATGATEETLDEAGLKKLAADIKQKANYQGDPTCQTILLIAAIYSKDYTAAKQLYEVVKAQHAKHLYANTDLNGIGSLTSYGSLVESLAPVDQNGSDEGAQGGA